MRWNPDQYLRFSSDRLRPAVDLVSRISIESPESILDLGCGTGTATAILRERFPSASILGIDSSAEMLEVANREQPSIYYKLLAPLGRALAALDTDRERDAFESEYRRRVLERYPKDAKGRTLFRFQRLFFVASV